jgi:hypothetical protein
MGNLLNGEVTLLVKDGKNSTLVLLERAVTEM